MFVKVKYYVLLHNFIVLKIHRLHTSDIDDKYAKYVKLTVYISVKLLPESLQTPVRETPVRMAFCSVRKNQESGYLVSTDDNGNCHDYIYVRSCNGKLQFDMTHMRFLGIPRVCFSMF